MAAASKRLKTRSKLPAPPLVGVIMGSQSDWSVMKHAADTLASLGVPYEAQIVSAHRTPERMYAYADSAQERGLKVILACAGGAAALPGMVASMTPLPVLGVPAAATGLQGFDSLMSIVQMPAGIPVGTLAIGRAGAVNAALLATAILGLSDAKLMKRLEEHRKRQTAAVPLEPKDEAASHGG
ncbi:N5-carboxyaminoimidazole ribonucleotide mutase [Alphaproteobacteria bacterium SO-S41]|nr:N5-carboxyaminoimidazole ribonucleotide mutase [Alphaproteobacteria bacterium SO-S41]